MEKTTLHLQEIHQLNFTDPTNHPTHHPKNHPPQFVGSTSLAPFRSVAVGALGSRRALHEPTKAKCTDCAASSNARARRHRSWNDMGDGEDRRSTLSTREIGDAHLQQQFDNSGRDVLKLSLQEHHILKRLQKTLNHMLWSTSWIHKNKKSNTHPVHQRLSVPYVHFLVFEIFMFCIKENLKRCQQCKLFHAFSCWPKTCQAGQKLHNLWYDCWIA